MRAEIKKGHRRIATKRRGKCHVNRNILPPLSLSKPAIEAAKSTLAAGSGRNCETNGGIKIDNIISEMKRFCGRDMIDGELLMGEVG